MSESNSEQYTAPEIEELEMEEAGLSILEIVTQLEKLKNLEKNEELDLLADSTEKDKEQKKKILDFLENEDVIERNKEEGVYFLNKNRLDELYSEYKTKAESIKAKEDKKFIIEKAIKRIEEEEEVRPTQKSLKKHLDLSRSRAQDLMDYFYSKGVIKKENGRKNVLNKEDNELVQRVLGMKKGEAEEPGETKEESEESAEKEQKEVEETKKEKTKKEQETQTESLEEKIKSTDEGKRFYDSLMSIPGIKLGGSIQKAVVGYLNKKWEGKLNSFLDTLKEDGFIDENGRVIKEEAIEKASEYLEENWEYENRSIDDFDLAWKWAQNHIDEKFDREELPFSDRIINRFLSADLLATHEDWDDIPEGKLLITQELNKRKDSNEIQEKLIPPVQEGEVYETEILPSRNGENKPVANFDGMWVVVNGATDEDIGEQKKIKINKVEARDEQGGGVAFAIDLENSEYPIENENGEFRVGERYTKRVDEVGRVKFDEDGGSVSKKVEDIEESNYGPHDWVDVRIASLENGEIKRVELVDDYEERQLEEAKNLLTELENLETFEDGIYSFEDLPEFYGKYQDFKRAINDHYPERRTHQKIEFEGKQKEARKIILDLKQRWQNNLDYYKEQNLEEILDTKEKVQFWLQVNADPKKGRIYDSEGEVRDMISDEIEDEIMDTLEEFGAIKSISRTINVIKVNEDKLRQAKEALKNKGEDAEIIMNIVEENVNIDSEELKEGLDWLENQVRQGRSTFKFDKGEFADDPIRLLLISKLKNEGLLDKEEKVESKVKITDLIEEPRLFEIKDAPVEAGSSLEELDVKKVSRDGNEAIVEYEDGYNINVRDPENILENYDLENFKKVQNLNVEILSAEEGKLPPIYDDFAVAKLTEVVDYEEEQEEGFSPSQAFEWLKNNYDAEEHIKEKGVFHTGYLKRMGIKEEVLEELEDKGVISFKSGDVVVDTENIENYDNLEDYESEASETKEEELLVDKLEIEEGSELQFEIKGESRGDPIVTVEMPEEFKDEYGEDYEIYVKNTPESFGDYDNFEDIPPIEIEIESLYGAEAPSGPHGRAEFEQVIEEEVGAPNIGDEFENVKVKEERGSDQDLMIELPEPYEDYNVYVQDTEDLDWEGDTIDRIEIVDASESGKWAKAELMEDATVRTEEEKTEPTEETTREVEEEAEVIEPIINQVKNKEAFKSIIGHLAEIHEQLKKESIGLLELEEKHKNSLKSQFEIFSGEKWSEDLDLSQFQQKLEEKKETIGINTESSYSKEAIDKINEVKAVIKEESHDFVERSSEYLEELKEAGVSKEDRKKIKNLALELDKQEKYLLRAENDLEDKMLSTKLKFKINKLKEKLDRVGREETETLSEKLEGAPAERKKDLIEMHKLRSEITEVVESMKNMSVQDLGEFSNKNVLTVLAIAKENPENTKEALGEYFDSLYKQEQEDKESNLNASIEFRNKLAHIKAQLENYTEKKSQQGEQEEIEKELKKAKNKLAKLRAEKQELEKGITGTIKTLLPTQDKKRLKKIEEDLIPEARKKLKNIVSEYKANAVDERLNKINESLLKTISEEVAEHREKSKIKKSLDWMSEKWRSLGSGTRIAIGFGVAGTTGAAAAFGGSATAAAAGIGYGGYRAARGTVGAVGGMFGYESLRAKTEKKEERKVNEGVNEILAKLESKEAEVPIEEINEQLLNIYTTATFEGKDPTDDDFSMNKEYEKLNEVLEQKEAQIEEVEERKEALEEYVLDLDQKIAEAAEDKEVIDKWQKTGGAAYGAAIGSGTFGSGVATVAGWSGEAVDGISSWLFGSEPVEESSEKAEEAYKEMTKGKYEYQTAVTEEGADYTNKTEASVPVTVDEAAKAEISGIVANESIEKGESFNELVDSVVSDYGKEELADKIKDSNPDWALLSDEQAIHNWKVEQTEKFGFSSSAELKYEDFGLTTSSENYKATIDLVFENEEPKLEINVPNDNIDIKDQNKVKKLVESGNLNLLGPDGNKIDLSTALESDSELEQGTEEVASEETTSSDKEITDNSAQNEVIETQFGRISFDYGSEGEVTGLSSEAGLSMSTSEISEEVFGQSDKFSEVFPPDAGLDREAAQSNFRQLIMYDKFYEQMAENGQASSQERKFLQEKILDQIEEVVQSNDKLNYSDFSEDWVGRYNMDVRYPETFSEAASSVEEAAENTITIGGQEVELLSGKAEDWLLENPNAEESEQLQEARNKLQEVAGSENKEDIEEAISEYRKAKEAVIEKVQ